MATPTDEEIEERIDLWQSGSCKIPVHEALGWTVEEWNNWREHAITPDRPLPLTCPCGMEKITE